jgi:hypothetical protein
VCFGCDLILIINYQITTLRWQVAAQAQLQAKNGFGFLGKAGAAIPLVALSRGGCQCQRGPSCSTGSLEGRGALNVELLW